MLYIYLYLYSNNKFYRLNLLYYLFIMNNQGEDLAIYLGKFMLSMKMLSKEIMGKRLYLVIVWKLLVGIGKAKFISQEVELANAV